jgi:transcriptional antiterminator RfaH
LRLASLSGPRWYVVCAQAGQERVAKEHLLQQGYETYLPMRLFLNRKQELVARPFFPRYMFVRVDLVEQAWRPILSTMGVRSMLMSGDSPMWLDGRIVGRLMAQEEGGFIKLADRKTAPIACRFEPGQRVRVKGGVLDKLEGVFFEDIDANRIVILLSVLGRDSRIEVDPAQVTECT